MLKFLIDGCLPILLIDKCSIFFNTVGVEKFKEIVIFIDVEFFICRIQDVDTSTFCVGLDFLGGWSVVGDDQSVAEFDGKFAERYIIDRLVLDLDKVGLEYAFAFHRAVEIARHMPLETVVEHVKHSLDTSEAGVFGKGLFDVDG